MKQKFFLSSLLLVCLLSQSFILPSANTRDVTGKRNETWGFQYHKEWVYGNCTYTVDFSVNIEVDLVHHKVVSVSASLIDGWIICRGLTDGHVDAGAIEIIPLSASAQHDDNGVTNLTLTCSNSQVWNITIANNKAESISDINNDINSSWPALK